MLYLKNPGMSTDRRLQKVFNYSFILTGISKGRHRPFSSGAEVITLKKCGKYRLKDIRDEFDEKQKLKAKYDGCTLSLSLELATIFYHISLRK